MSTTLQRIAYFFLFISCIKINATDKWIVVTTINYPTAALKQLAQLPDWHLVVVADKKTPCDWHLDNCEFLSVEKQQQLPYKIIQFLPWNHYSRKNIGYLYAIEHGARIIYETDDDNYLIDNEIGYLPEHATTIQYITDQSTVNPYEHFGQPNVWPRGYPLKKIIHNQQYQTVERHVHCPIQQGVVNNDPDVDAIYRLTHSQEINFDSNKKPLSLQRGVLCPFNSQNTIFYYNAFWALLLPVTPSFRVCDIWRSYWMQRLLWDFDGSVCFLAPTAVQYRNEHNLLTDFADEIDVYLKSEQLINTLRNWKCEKKVFVERMEELMNELIIKQYFKPAEIALVTAWIEDLERINYSMPQ